jgi:diguanylate cyclase
MKKNIFTNRFSLIVFSFLISGALGVLLFGINQLEKQFEETILDIATKDILTISKNTTRSIQDKFGESNNYIQTVTNSLEIQKELDEKLSLLLTKNIKYAYLLYRDAKGTFRFLADGANGEDKAFVNQKLDIQNSQWHDIYQKKKPIMIQQPLLHQLSITYLIPMIKENEVRLILAIDFSIGKKEDINKIITFVKNIIIALIFIILLFTLILIIQMFKYFTIKKTAYMDKLTNVYNRNYLHNIQDTINLQEYILAAIDIDFFKKINDQYGHDIGDLILHEVAKTMIDSIRSNEDILIRYGGEEFVILVKKQDSNGERSLNIIKRVFQSIQEKGFKTPNGDKLNITISIGINLYPNESRNFKEAFKLADNALYRAKAKGRNKIEIDSH